MSWKLVAGNSVAALAFFLTGCGTIYNFPESHGALAPQHATRLPYGGVKMDATSGVDLANTALDFQTEHLVLIPLSAYLLLVDLPLSAIGDTLTLPYVLYMGPSGMPPLPSPYAPNPPQLSDSTARPIP
jgi:uncharacterized protein YceK